MFEKLMEDQISNLTVWNINPKMFLAPYYKADIKIHNNIQILTGVQGYIDYIGPWGVKYCPMRSGEQYNYDS